MTETRTTEDVLDHHTQSFMDGNIDELVSDYTEESIMFTSNGPVRGLKQLRTFFETFLNSVPDTFVADYKIMRKDIDGEVAYTLWRSGTFTPMGTDTFIVRDGKFIIQSTAAYVPG